jgi:hypothetical protein
VLLCSGSEPSRERLTIFEGMIVGVFIYLAEFLFYFLRSQTGARGFLRWLRRYMDMQRASLSRNLRSYAVSSDFVLSNVTEREYFVIQVLRCSAASSPSARQTANSCRHLGGSSAIGKCIGWAKRNPTGPVPYRTFFIIYLSPNLLLFLLLLLCYYLNSRCCDTGIFLLK